jgi:zinc transport system permease protein
MWNILKYGFMQNALMAGVLASIACGIIGTFIIVKRMVFISGGISHSAFGGIGLGYLLGIDPLVGALIFTFASALGIGVITKRAKQREDTAIGILWTVAMAVGVIFTGLSQDYPPDPSSILFGSILTVPRTDILLMILLNVVIIGTVLLLYKELLAISFDEEFATVVGVPTESLYFVLLSLIALTVVMVIKVVGIILVIALLTIPAAISGQITRNLKTMMLFSIIFGSIFTLSGLWFSYLLDLASGATIVVVSGIAFIFSLLWKKIKLVHLNKRNVQDIKTDT